MKQANPLRISLYKKIEVARKQLPHMNDDDFFRDYLEDNFKVRSRKELTTTQLIRLVDMLARAGAVYTSKGSNKKVTPKARPDWIEVPDGTPFADEKRKICAIWKKLGYSMTSLETRVKRQFNLASFAWLKEKQPIMTLLTDLQKRERTFDRKQKEKAGEVA